VTGHPGARFRIVVLQLPGESHILELIQYTVGQGEPLRPETNRPGAGHVCFLVDDLPAAYERLRACGVRFVSPPVLITQGVNRGGYAVYMHDPDGATIELLQRAVAVPEPQ
jgi:catechol 2,3-dioxygenase-like lactoylglutathione lyase family enzyme